MAEGEDAMDVEEPAVGTAADVRAGVNAGAAAEGFDEDPRFYQMWVELEEQHRTLYSRQYIVAMQYRHQYDQYCKGHNNAGDFPSYMRAIAQKAGDEDVSEARANKLGAMGKARIEFFREDFDAVLGEVRAYIDLDAGHSHFVAETASAKLEAYLTKKGWSTAAEVDAAYLDRQAEKTITMRTVIKAMSPAEAEIVVDARYAKRGAVNPGHQLDTPEQALAELRAAGAVKKGKKDDKLSKAELEFLLYETKTTPSAEAPKRLTDMGGAGWRTDRPTHWLGRDAIWRDGSRKLVARAYFDEREQKRNVESYTSALMTSRPRRAATSSLAAQDTVAENRRCVTYEVATAPCTQRDAVWAWLRRGRDKPTNGAAAEEAPNEGEAPTQGERAVFKVTGDLYDQGVELIYRPLEAEDDVVENFLHACEAAEKEWLDGQELKRALKKRKLETIHASVEAERAEQVMFQEDMARFCAAGEEVGRTSDEIAADEELNTAEFNEDVGKRLDTPLGRELTDNLNGATDQFDGLSALVARERAAKAAAGDDSATTTVLTKAVQDARVKLRNAQKEMADWAVEGDPPGWLAAYHARGLADQSYKQGYEQGSKNAASKT